MLLLIFLTGCAHNQQHQQGSPAAEPELARYEYEQAQMGVPFRIVLYAPNKYMAKIAAHTAYQRVSDLNQILSDYETDSELNQLSRTSGQDKWVPVSPDLWNVLSRAQKLARQSDGAFDVTVGPCVSLWRYARRTHQMPNPVRLSEALKAVGHEKMQLDAQGRRVKLLVPGMKLDLGAIAKGYAVDEAIKALSSRGIKRALVAGSGDIAVSDPPPGKPGWRVDLGSLDVSNAPPARALVLSNMSLATSGDLFQRLEIDGKRYSHIVDPRTGIGLTDHSLVTVVARDCTTADSLATTVSVLGPKKGLELLRAYRGTAAHITRKTGDELETFETRAFRRFYAQP